jgi:hypothetical protein
VPFHAARAIMHFAGTVNGHADVFQESLRGQVGQRFGALGTDDRAVGREIPADVSLAAEDFHHVKDVLAHEDLAAGQLTCSPFCSGNARWCISIGIS